MRSDFGGVDLASLRALLQGEEKISLGVVRRVEVLDDLTQIRALVEELPAQNEIVAKFTFPHCSGGNGFFAPPVSGDLVVLVWVDDVAHVVAYIPTKDDLIPQQVADGDAMLRAAQQLHLAGTKVLLGKGVAGADPDEPLPLGNVLLACIGDLYTRLNALMDRLIAGPLGIDSAGGSVIPHPTLTANLTADKGEADSAKSEYVTEASTNIVSQVSFTERGS